MARQRKLLTLTVAALTALTLMLSGCGQSSQPASTPAPAATPESQPPAQPEPQLAPPAPVVLKLGTKMPPENPEGKGFQKFADLAKEKSGGSLIVEVYPSEQLGTGTTQIDNVMLGTQDMYAEGSTYFARFDKDFNIASVPYLFESNEQYQKVVTGPIGQRMNESLIKEGMRILNTDRSFVRGPYRVICATKPINSLADVKGLKLRSFESDVYHNAWNHLGANPTVIAWTETYLAIKQNVVSAVTSPISLVYSMKFTEVAPYCTEINEFPQDVVIVISEKTFAKLSAEHQQILTDAANEAGEYATQLVYDSIKSDIERMEQEHKAQFIQVDLKPFQERMADYFYQLEDKGFISKGIIDEIRATR